MDESFIVKDELAVRKKLIESIINENTEINQQRLHYLWISRIICDRIPNDVNVSIEERKFLSMINIKENGDPLKTNINEYMNNIYRPNINNQCNNLNFNNFNNYILEIISNVNNNKDLAIIVPPFQISSLFIHKF